MRDSQKVVIGFGSIWGLLVFGGVLMIGFFTLGANDSVPEVSALMLYGFTSLPACIAAIWFPKPAGYWLLTLFPLAASGWIYQIFVRAGTGESRMSLAGSTALALMLAAVPGLIGWLLVRGARNQDDAFSRS